MKLSEISIQRPVLASMMSLGLILFGIIGLSRLPVRELPDIDPPIVNVTTIFSGASAAVVEAQVTEPLEESLYLAWSSRNEDRSLDEFYDTQRQEGMVITGIVEPYVAPVKMKPGDYVIKDKDLTKAYLYSTQINLNEYVGKKVTVMVTPRSNNNFAFPAYFVLSVE